MQGLARAPWLQAAIASMRMSNAVASRVLREFGAGACTDVTGFGLTGHLLEMLRASGVGAVLWPDQLPALPGAVELAAHGVASTLAPENRRLLPGLENTPRAALLFDPQTSGGLLAGIAGDCAEACVAALRSQGIAATVIGVVEQGQVALRLAASCHADPDR